MEKDKKSDTKQLISLKEIKERIKKAEMLFQIKTFEISWSECKKTIVEILSYPIENYPSQFAMDGWEKLTEYLLSNEISSKEKETPLLKRIYKIINIEQSFSKGQAISAENNTYILTFLKAIFKKTLGSVKNLGYIPTSVEKENGKIQEKVEKESTKRIKNSTSYGIELLHYDLIRGPVSFIRYGNKLNETIRSFMKNSMDTKKGMFTIEMDGWVIINGIKEISQSDDLEIENEKLIHFMVFWEIEMEPELNYRRKKIELEIEEIINQLKNKEKPHLAFCESGELSFEDDISVSVQNKKWLINRLKDYYHESLKLMNYNEQEFTKLIMEANYEDNISILHSILSKIKRSINF